MLERRRRGIEESFEFKFIRKDGSFSWISKCQRWMASVPLNAVVPKQS
ncbi:MAG: hypothetical protein WB392_06645 [Methanotrichaceae archaeon]